MWIKKSQVNFAAGALQEGDVVKHIEEGEYLKDTLIWVGNWIICINWHVESELAPHGVYQTMWLPDILPIPEQNELASPSFTIDMNGIVTIDMMRKPCVIDGCLVTSMVEDESVTTMWQSLLTQKNARNFYHKYTETYALEGQDLKLLAIEIWKEQGGRVLNI